MQTRMTRKRKEKLKRKTRWEEKKRKVEVENAIVTLKESLAKEAIASGTCGNKIREHATKAAAFAIKGALCVREKT